MGKKWTEEEKKAFGVKMKALREAKLAAAQPAPTTEQVTAAAEQVTEPSQENIDSPATDSRQSNDDLLQILKANQDVLLSLLQERQAAPQQNGIGVGNNGRLLGEIEKYTVDPINYADPTQRLKLEPRLEQLAFNHHYELDYEMIVRPYETKTGVNQKEPEFIIKLHRIMRDGQGNDTGKRARIQWMIFHEDPQAALVIARDNGLDLGEFGDLEKTDNQRAFLNEMRYLRVRDWLFDKFWPKGADQNQSAPHEEVINGTIIQVFSKPVGEPGGLDFDKITAKF